MSIFNYKEEKGYFQRMKEALKFTTEDISGQISEVLGGKESPMTEGHLEDLEAILIGADIGVQTSSQIIEKITAEPRSGSRKTRSVGTAAIASDVRKTLSSPIES